MSTSSSGADGLGPAGEEGERHASWLELFFDLIAVAGVGQLAHLLRTGPSWAAVGEYALLFLAFWFAWVMSTMYGNVAGRGTRLPAVVGAMFGMAVMAAAVPEVRASDERACAFALAYIVVRLIASRVWSGRRQVVADLPIIQLGAGLTPWIVSLWVQGDARLWLWAAGLVIDLVVMLRVSREVLQAEIDEHWAQAEERVERRLRRPGRRGEVARSAQGAGGDDARGRGRVRPKPEVVTADIDHLAERLGLFLLITLGEGLVQSVDAAGEAPWDAALRTVGVGAFVLLVLIWALALRTGTYGVPLLAPRALPVRLVLPLHCLFAGVVAALAAVLGRTVAEPGGVLGTAGRLLLAAVLALILLVAATGALVSGRGPRWTAAAVIPGLVVVAVLALGKGLGGTDGPGTEVVVGLAVVTIAWPVYWYECSGRTPATRRPLPG